MNTASATDANKLGFWACWSLTVGVTVGSGIFLLPSVLAEYGTLSFAGWLITAGGSIALAFVFARLSVRIPKSGGVYIYTRESLGDLPGFLIAWSYWTSYWIAIPATAIAFVGYLGVFIPELSQSPLLQAVVALSIIWTAIGLNIVGIKEATTIQLIVTVLKLVPLLVIILLGALFGSASNIPAFNPQGLPLWEALAATTLLTMWAFSGLESAVMPASDVKEPQKTVPRAILWGTATVAFIYIASTAAVMSLVPNDQLALSQSPYADAASALGTFGPLLIALGALVSTAGSLNGLAFVAGQMPMAVALDGLAPKAMARRNRGDAPFVALLIVGVLASALLLSNYSQGLVETFKLIITMSTLSFLLPMAVCAGIELRHSLQSRTGWAAVAFIALVYSLLTMLGTELNILLLGLGFFSLGIPMYFIAQRSSKAMSSIN